ncbi:NAD(P)H-quinone oxidoreductase [Pseudonocardia eucalypti]|uniref:NAD(P)H-quinone oxidoreductase n=1 Tax=Pseudonocardia eucalypti TaxID=648755 RepID=A0ABP9QZA0_9PSEU|nr:putative PIG3 family NAD(P)H quinone oxidoreductase [Pseudonocardia eucalypti]
MYAITVREPGGPEVLEWTEVDDPAPGPGEVLIDVAATAVNRADLLQRQGFYPPPPGASPIIGLECAGRVAALGEGVEGWHTGDEVCALLSGGGYAQKVAVPAGQVLPAPPGWSLTDAGGLPEVACTVWSNLFDVANLRAGELVLIQGGTGGIGTHAIQVAAAVGARVAATAGSEDRRERCLSLGAELALDYRSEKIAEELREATEGRGADVILDNMGAAALADNIDRLAPGGRLVIIGLQGGVKAEINLNAMLRKRASVTATNLRGRPTAGPDGKAAIVAAVRAGLWPLLESGQVKPVVQETLPLNEAGRAHQLLTDGGVVGKLVLANPDF